MVGTVGIWLSVLFLAPTERADLRGFLYFALAGIVGTTGGRLFRFMAIERVGASVSSALINLYPFVAAGLAILLLGEAVTMSILAGTAVIVGGTILLSASGSILGFRTSELIFPFVSATIVFKVGSPQCFSAAAT